MLELSILNGCAALGVVIYALHVISPDAAKEAKERNIKYSNVEEIAALADRYGQKKHIFRLYDGTHFVALTERHYVDDNSIYS